MLNIRNFDVNNEAASEEVRHKSWQELQDTKVVVPCKKCGKMIWSRWHSEHNFIDECILCFKP